MMESTEIKVMLVDDHAIVREGVASMLRQVEGIRVVGSAGSGEEAVSQAQVLKPDVILMDIVMGGMTGIEATRWIKEQNNSVRIILLSSEVKKEFVSAGIQSGVDGYVHKDSTKDVLIDAIRTVSKSGRYFNDAITSLVFEDFYTKEKYRAPKAVKDDSGLSKREQEVLMHVAMGKSNKEVADTLFISIKTVETHKTNILSKLGLRNTAELVRYAIKNNIIPME